MEEIMKKIVAISVILLLTSCSLSPWKDKEILQLQNTISEQNIEIEKLQKRHELKQKIEKIKHNAYLKKQEDLKNEIQKLKNTNSNNLQVKQAINIEKEKELDIRFYSQFPLDISTGIKYDEPYQNFCEEASLLNGYYFLTGEQPDLKQYNNDLSKLKELEDILFDGWYMHTSLQDTLKLLIAFQWDNQKIFWEIIQKPSIKTIKENISKWNPIVVPVYGKWLSNDLFIWGWPVYHNLLIKWYTEQNFIVNEVWVSKWDGYNYNIQELMENIANYDEKLYPDNFKKWKKEILILYK